MKYPLLLFLAICLLACNHKDAGQNNAEYHTKGPLSITDLKFPLIDEDNDSYLLPIPYNNNIATNHISKRIAIQIPRSIDEYGDVVRRMYKKDTKNKKIAFSDWAINAFGLSDTDFYNGNGQLIKYKESCSWPQNFHYEYDSNGFLIREHGGSDPFIDRPLLNFFDTIKHILYLVNYSSDHSFKPNKIWDMENFSRITVYHFDSSGYLKTITHNNRDGTLKTKSQFEYNSQNKVQSIHFWLKTKKGSEEEGYTDPKRSVDDISFESVTKYCYHLNYLDSITTQYFYRDPHRNYTRKTYFDTSGLPYKTENSNPRFLMPKTTIYQYIKS